jgi:opacity protein-like surface antigen
MNRIPSYALTAAAVLLLFAAPASAQRIDSPYRFLDHSQSLGVYGGYLNAAEGRIGAGPQSAPIFGATWHLRVSGPFALGVDIGLSPSSRTVRDTSFVVEDSSWTAVGDADMTLLVAMANLRFNVTGARTWNGLQPFLLFGAGVAVDLSGTSEVDLEVESNARFSHGTSFAGQLGAGLEWFPSSRLSLNAAARNVLWKVRVPEAFVLTEAGRSLPRSEWEQNFVLAAGLSLHF